jgi:ligand-binding sensor domain-containing protein
MTTAALGPDGDVWFGTPINFARFDGEVWTNYQLADGKPIDIFAIGFDSDGQTWFSALEGIGRFDGQTFQYYTYGDSNPFNDISNPELIGMSIAGIVDSMAFGPDGAIWMSAGPLGLIRFEEPS